VRSGAYVASALLFAGFCGILLFASRTERLGAMADSSVEALMLERAREPPPRPRTAPIPPSAPRSPIPAAEPTIEAQMLARMLRCYDRLDPARARDCPPREAATDDWRASARLPVGGDFAEPEPLDLNDAFTVAEQRTLVMPRCEGVCVPVGPIPPPPSRSPEELCELGGIGPCHPPPFRPEDVRRGVRR
jgi:hypothetical protein